MAQELIRTAEIFSDYRVREIDEGLTFICYANGGDINFYLPYALNFGSVIFKKADDSLNVIRIHAKGPDSIDGSAMNGQFIIDKEFTSVSLISNKENRWFAITEYVDDEAALSGSPGDHGFLTGLSDNDHPQYVHVSGSNKMAVNFDLQGFDIINVGTFNGVNLFAVTASLDDHISDVNNPHATKFSTLDPETLNDLNSAITDANLDDSGSARTPLAHAASHLSGASDEISAQNLAAAGVPVGHVMASDGQGGWITALSTSGVITDHGSLTGLDDDDHILYVLNSDFEQHSSSINAFTASTLEHISAVNSYTASNNQTTSSLLAVSASYNFFSASHREMHLSGGRDQIDLQALGANEVPANSFPISNLSGGWTTILSSSLSHSSLAGRSEPSAHPQYLLLDGSRPMSGTFNMASGAIISASSYNGVEIGDLRSDVDTHIIDVNNPHATDFGVLDPDTLANLNAAISDDNVIGESEYLEFSASVIASASGVTVSEHENLDTLVHNLAETSYNQYIYSGKNLVTKSVWTSVAMTDRVRESRFSYGGAGNKFLTSSIEEQYDVDGSTVVQTLNKIFFYSGNDLINIDVTES